ncbi:MAG: papain-like cysteine protease family protein [Burkholderiaceae bacterium]
MAKLIRRSSVRLLSTRRKRSSAGDALTAPRSTGSCVLASAGAAAQGNPMAVAGSTWRRLSVHVPTQLHDNWCWCATALGIHQSLGQDVTMTQCEAANLILERVDACTNGSDPNIDRTYELDIALEKLGNLRLPRIDQPIAFANVFSEVVNGQVPVGIRVGRKEDTQRGHFLIINGCWEESTLWVSVSDPINGDSDMFYIKLRDDYLNEWKWTHSYLIQR